MLQRTKMLQKKKFRDQNATIIKGWGLFAPKFLKKILDTKGINVFLFLPERLSRTKVMIQAAEEEDHEEAAIGPERRTIHGALLGIWRREGPLGFFKGLQAQILKTVLSSALHLMIKEKIAKATWVLLLAVRSYFSANRVRLKMSWLDPSL